MRITQGMLSKKGSFVLTVCVGAICLLLGLGCYAQNCKDIPSSFASYTQAEKTIRRTEFVYVDQISIPESSWIKGATYYSCDGKIGFFLIKTDKGKSYLFQGMSIAVWRDFKAAKSHGVFYNEKIRNKYRLNLINQ